MGNRERGTRGLWSLVALACVGVSCVLAALDTSFAQSAGEPAPDQTPLLIPDSRPSISLLTIGPGELFFERFGHNAIVVREAGRPAVVYNYGIFDFAQEDFLLNFARGRMVYRVIEGALADDLEMYRAQGRSIVEQVLDVDAARARELVDFLAWNVLPENTQYRYDYFEANCSTRVRDALDRALDGALRAHAEGRSRGYTWRLDALRLMAPEPWLMLGIDLGLGPYADQRIDYWQESFVPETLSRVAAEATRADATGAQVPVVSATTVLAPGLVEEPPLLPPDLRWPFLALGLALGAVLHGLARDARSSRRLPLASFALAFELVCGLGGLLLLFLWFGTEHRAAWRNENLMLLNPLCLALLPAWWGIARGRLRPRPVASAIAGLVALLAAFALFSKILPWFAQANLHWIVLLLPIHLALAFALARPARVHAGPG